MTKHRRHIFQIGHKHGSYDVNKPDDSVSAISALVLACSQVFPANSNELTLAPHNAHTANLAPPKPCTKNRRAPPSKISLVQHHPIGTPPPIRRSPIAVHSALPNATPSPPPARDEVYEQFVPCKRLYLRRDNNNHTELKSKTKYASKDDIITAAPDGRSGANTDNAKAPAPPRRKKRQHRLMAMMTTQSEPTSLNVVEEHQSYVSFQENLDFESMYLSADTLAMSFPSQNVATKRSAAFSMASRHNSIDDDDVDREVEMESDEVGENNRADTKVACKIRRKSGVKWRERPVVVANSVTTKDDDSDDADVYLDVETKSVQSLDNVKVNVVEHNGGSAVSSDNEFNPWDDARDDDLFEIAESQKVQVVNKLDDPWSPNAKLKQCELLRRESVDIFERERKVNVFEDFDDIFKEPHTTEVVKKTRVKFFVESFHKLEKSQEFNFNDPTLHAFEFPTENSEFFHNVEQKEQSLSSNAFDCKDFNQNNDCDGLGDSQHPLKQVDLFNCSGTDELFSLKDCSIMKKPVVQMGRTTTRESCAQSSPIMKWNTACWHNQFSNDFDAMEDKSYTLKAFSETNAFETAAEDETSFNGLSKDELLRCIMERLQDGSSHQLQGDVALNHSISLSTLESALAKSGGLQDSSDQVLLRLVHRLASLQQQSASNQAAAAGESNLLNKQTEENSNGSPTQCRDKQGYEEHCVGRKKSSKDLLKEDAASYRHQPDEQSTHCHLNGSAATDTCDIGGGGDGKGLTTIMGSNVSRHSGKGLSGRRIQSEGNLYNGKHQAPNGAYYTPNNKRKCENKANRTKTINNATPPPVGDDPAAVAAAVGAAAALTSVTSAHSPLAPSGQSKNSFELYPCRKKATATKLIARLALATLKKNNGNKLECESLPNYLDADERWPNMYAANDSGMQSNCSDNNNLVDRVEFVSALPPKFDSLPHQQQLLSSTVESSPYNNSGSSDQVSIASTSTVPSTFRSIRDNRPDSQPLKFPVNRSNFDPACDQGYGSERSPEDEMPPPLPLLASPFQAQQAPAQNHVHWDLNECEYNFITPDCTFMVHVAKGPRGLGLSVSGGVDTNGAFPGLIRIKRLFPHQAAWSTGMLQTGDILLEANGTTLTGLTNYEALEILRTSPNNVSLTVCRPRDEQYRKLSPPTEPPRPPQRIHPNSIPLEPIQTCFIGDFEIIMVKQQGSLGFTLRKEDESVLGHYVRALVREPATTDGRIKPADKIVAVNDVLMSPMTHEEAVIFLRQASDVVKLRLYRDSAQTPVAAMSPTNSENRTMSNTLKNRVRLRPEAINLLNTLAYNRKQTPGTESSAASSMRSNTTSPRRLRRGTKNSSQSDLETSESKSSSNLQYVVTSQPTSVCSDSEKSLDSQCSFVVQSNYPLDHNDMLHATYVVEDVEPKSEYYDEEELFTMVDSEYNSSGDGSSSARPDRPNFLDLGANSVGGADCTTVVSRKPRFQFTVAANAYELNKLDNDALDAPIYTLTNTANGSDSFNASQDSQDFQSLPCEIFLVACKTESDLKRQSEPHGDHPKFNHKNPAYQSAHVAITSDIVETTPSDTRHSTGEQPKEVIKKEGTGTKSLLKWKGVMFSPDEEEKPGDETSGADLSCTATIGTNPTPGTEKDMDFNSTTTDADGHKIVTAELNRGWNSRLGFSLQNDPTTKQTYISAIYKDSVAAKDGRLRVGDQILMVNDESVEFKPTPDIIELLRIVRGSIFITALRKEPS